MENKNLLLLNEHLKSLQSMQEAAMDEFFYTRLKARLDREVEGKNNLQQQGWVFPLKPIWVIGTLVLLLAVNSIMIAQQFTSKKNTTEISSTPTLQNFVEEFHLSI